MEEHKPGTHSAERHTPGGQKDTDDLSGVKGIQDKGMQEKGKQVDELPESVKGTDVHKYPQQR